MDVHKNAQNNQPLTNPENKIQLPDSLHDSSAQTSSLDTQKYIYIEEDQLSKNFGFCMDTKNKTFKTHFCLYSINTQCYVEGVSESPNETVNYGDVQSSYNSIYPFLQFVLQKGEQTYSFPNAPYECPVMPNADKGNEGFNFFGGDGEDVEDEMSEDEFEIEEDDVEDTNNKEPANIPSEKSAVKTQEQIHFENTCFQTLLNFFTDVSDLHKIYKPSLYKGFIQYDDENIVVVYDVSILIKYLKPEYTIGIIDELVYKKKILSIPVDDFVISFFKTNKKMRHIRTHDGEQITFPFQLYMCNYKTDHYENVLKTDVLQYEPNEHLFMGPAYYFTTDILKEGDEVRRFACFITRTYYMSKDLAKEEISDEEKKEHIVKILRASSFYFHENEVQLWGVKNILHFVEY